MIDNRWLRQQRLRGTYSQAGEDALVLELLGASGLYLDIGANHPFKGSNTYLLYEHGWSGLTVDPIKLLCEQHRRLRPRDVCLNAAVSDRPGQEIFHELNPSGFSTFDTRAADELTHAGRAVRAGTYEVPVVRATDVWNQSFPALRADLISIDTEGFELEVIDGLDFKILEPRVVLVEFQAATGSERESAVTEVLADRGYRLDRVVGVNGLFVPSGS